MLISSTGVYDLCVRKPITGSISYYQKYLSPLKGYSCAHRILHRGESCSQYVKHTFGEQDFKTAFLLMRERFNECSLAALELKRLAAQSNDCSCENCCSDSQGNECSCLKCCCCDQESRGYCRNCQEAFQDPEFYKQCSQGCDESCNECSESWNNCKKCCACG